MFPDFHFLLKDIFGIDIPFLSLFKMFGFLVAIAFLVAGYFLYKEIKRKEDAGLIPFEIKEITTGKPATVIDYISNALLGFILGYKVIGMFLNFKEASPDPLSFMFSSKGNLLFGIIGAVILLGYKIFISYKEKATEITTQKVKVLTSSRVGDIAVIAAVGGFAGAKIFNAFETWSDFIKDPLSIISSSGLTFYGGLILATVLLFIFSQKIKLDFRHLCDAAAPALIIGYAIGRLGCQISGDGDWGIYNSAYITNEQGKVVTTLIPFDSLVLKHQEHISHHFKKEDIIPHKAFTTTALPTWLIAYNYPHNVNNVGEPLANCDGDYCNVLPLPVYPTPIYEFVMGLCIFFILWRIRKRFATPLSIFSLYLILNGIERFFIEQIRVNAKMSWLNATQAEFIAVCLIAVGVILWFSKEIIDKKVKLHSPEIG